MDTGTNATSGASALQGGRHVAQQPVAGGAQLAGAGAPTLEVPLEIEPLGHQKCEVLLDHGLVDLIVRKAAPDEHHACASGQRSDRPEAEVAATHHVVARKIVLVQHIGQHQGVGVGAVGGQERQCLPTVQLPELVESVLVHLHFPRARVQGAHGTRPHIDGQAALYRHEFVQRRHRAPEHLVLGQIELVGQLAQLRAKLCTAGDLLYHLARHLVAVAGEVPLGPLQCQHRATEDEAGEMFVVLLAGLGGEVGPQLAQCGWRPDDHARAVRFTLHHSLLGAQDRASQGRQRQYVGPAGMPLAVALPGQPRHPDRHHERVVAPRQGSGHRLRAGVDHFHQRGSAAHLAHPVIDQRSLDGGRGPCEDQIRNITHAELWVHGDHHVAPPSRKLLRIPAFGDSTHTSPWISEVGGTRRSPR